MRKLSCYIFLLIIYSTYSYAQNALNRFDDKGRKSGLWISVDDSGNLASASYYSDGTPDGLFLTFNSKGEIITDTLYDSGTITQWENVFSDTIKPYHFDQNGNPLTGYSTPFRNMDGSQNYYLIKDGYTHGVSVTHLQLLDRKEFYIFYMDKLIYMILCDRRERPVSYYTNLWLYRPYRINKCITNGKVLTIEFENTGKYNILVPALQSRTLSYVRGKGDLFHEMYNIVRDTLIVNLNHFHPANRFFAEHHIGPKRIEKKRVNYRWHQFLEKELEPNSTIRQEVKIYNHNVYIAWIVLIIENKRYVFRNMEWSQEKPVLINPVQR